MITFDPALATSRDWVRLEIGDHVVATALLEDESIDYVLAEESNKYLAAARCAEILIARWETKRGGRTEKQVDNLRIRYSDGTTESDYRQHIKWLRERGAELLIPKGQRFFSVV